jgi:hypothetical protein
MEIKLSQVAASVSKTNQTQREDAIFKMGMSAVSLGGFFFVAAFVLRSTLVPELPAPDLPPVSIPSIIPDDFGKVPAAASQGPATSRRLAWRRDQGPTLLGDIGVDRDHLHEWATSILKLQKEDGGFAGGDPLATTALATLALQAAPDSDLLTAAARSRTWLKAKSKDLSSQSAFARSLTLTALADAEDLPPDLWSTNKGYLSDGQAAVWQAVGVALLPSTDRRTDHSLLRGTSQDPLWVAWWDAVEGKAKDPVPDTAFEAVDTKNLVVGEDRLMWAQEAWFLLASSDDLTQTLEAWSRTDPVPVDPGLLSRTAAWAPTAVAILTVASPLRLPPLAFSAP